MAWDTTILTPFATSTLREKNGLEPMVATGAVRKKIEVQDFFLNPKTVTFKGDSIYVEDIDLFFAIIQDWMKRYKWTKNEALAEFFSMDKKRS